MVPKWQNVKNTPAENRFFGCKTLLGREKWQILRVCKIHFVGDLMVLRCFVASIDLFLYHLSAN
jgi:hypothetical protein